MKRLSAAALVLFVIASLGGCKKQAAEAFSEGNYYNGGYIAQKEGDAVYYIGTSEGIYRVERNSRTRISDQKSAKYLAIDRDDLYYVADSGIYRMKLDGSSRQPVVQNVSDRLQIAGDTLYYWSSGDNADGGGIYSKPLSSASATTDPKSGRYIADSSYYYCVDGDNLYFIQGSTLYRSDLNGNNKTELLRDCQNFAQGHTDRFLVHNGTIYYAKSDNKGTYSIYAKSVARETTLDVRCAGGIFNIYKDHIYFGRTIVTATGEFDISLARCDLTGVSIEVLDKLTGQVLDSGFSNIFVANDTVYLTDRYTKDVIYRLEL